jgi:membrane protease YdiL (CAAX protease family)
VTALAAPERAAVAGWRSSRWLAVVELAAVVAIFLAARAGLIPYTKTPVLWILGWASLRLRRLGWRSVGLGGPDPGARRWTATLAYGIAGGVALEALELFATQPLLIRLLGRKPDLSGFDAVRGNLGLLALGLALIWTLAAFGEEMVYRGYLMNRIADLGGRTRAAWLVSLVVANAAFGLGHAYQGITGILDEGLMGALLGAMYLGSRRNLAIPILAHGVQDTVDAVLLFLGAYPGL